MEKTFSAHCTHCDHTFQVRVPEGTISGRKYHIRLTCPRCGAQFTETKTIGGDEQTGTAGGGKKPGSARGDDRRQGLKYIIGIPIAVLLVVFLVSAIAGGFGQSSPLGQDLRMFGQRVERYLGSGGLMLVCAKLIVLFICFPAHECAHAWTADRLGDPTARKAGRITLNPLKHLDPMGTIMIILCGVGYAKPVPVRIEHFKNPKRDFALTAIAGPISNLIMAILFLLLIRILSGVMGVSETRTMVLNVLVYAVYINISLAIFNLIPIPPLDGSRVVTAFLPDGAYRKMLHYERYMMIGLLVLIFILNRAGYSPIGFLSEKVFRFLYGIIVGR